jgi:predicted DNA-binding transcriptional regulator YafY
MLPPLMFSEEEIEALVLGGRWVTSRADELLQKAARNAMSKIAAVLPRDLQRNLETSTLLIGPARKPPKDTSLPAIREAIRRGRKVDIAYADDKGRETQRTIWPFALGFFDDVRVVVAWCELRQGYRHFRADRIRSLKIADTPAPKGRMALLKEWRALENIAQP